MAKRRQKATPIKRVKAATPSGTKFVLTHKRAPGDTLVLTALVRDIQKAYPGKYQVDVQTSAMDLWRHNPHLTKLRSKKKVNPGVRQIKMEYGRGIRDQNYESVHFMSYFHRDFERQTGIHVPVSLPYPDLHLSKEEREIPVVSGRYWIVLSGGKSDFTAKVWAAERFQQVVDGVNNMGLGVVQLGGNDSGHWHPELTGTLDLIGKTNLRDMMRLIHHAEGVICGITCAMHMAAALQRPCVVLAGGREAWWWEAYVKENKGLMCPEKLTMPHQFLHTIGLLDCCKKHGCWKNKVLPLKNDKSLCYHPVSRPGQAVPLCMDMINSNHVMESVMKYYEDKSLPPINQGGQAPPTPAVATPKPVSMLNLFDTAEEPAEKPATPGQPVVTKTKKDGTKATVSIPASMLNGKNININAKASMETRGKNRPTKVARSPGTLATVGNDDIGDAVFDHVDVGGKYTICVLFYGDEKYHALHKRCLQTIISTVPKGRMDLRVGSNELNAKSLAMIEGYVKDGTITKHYRHKTNEFKYPVMREMFFDKNHPITTKWVLWFDDDSIADRTPGWLKLLSQHIVQYHRRNNAHMFGAPYVWTLQSGQRKWFEARKWYKGKPWRLHNGKPSPSGNKINFVAGGFWAATYDCIVACDIPDSNIGHNGGDVTIGEQLYQGGFGMKAWNGKKQFIYTSSVPRRGETLPMPGQVGHDKIPKLIQI